jgi:ketosteroid isomerase-like protein
MSESTNVTLVRRLYESGMAPEVTAEITAPDLVWDITPGFPYGGVYHGWDSVARDFFGQLGPRFESFAARPERYFTADDTHVVVEGNYHAVPKGGSEVVIRFSHLWTVRGGQLAHLVQTADSHVMQQALAA